MSIPLYNKIAKNHQQGGIDMSFKNIISKKVKKDINIELSESI